MHGIQSRWLLVLLVLLATMVGAAGPAPVQAADTCPCTLFAASATPTTANWPDAQAVEVGVKFFADSPGYVDGVRFYKGSSNTGSHLGNLWTAGGQLLATGTFTGESASGWQSLKFASPVPVQANTVYVASYHTTVGFYSADPNFFAQQLDAGLLHAPAGGNGVFVYGASAFPSQTFHSTNYWVDVSYDPALTTTALSSSANPSLVGQPLTLTATVSPLRAAPAPPTGNVTFYDGAQALGSAALGGGSPDQASFTTSSLAAGDHALSAVYGGSSAFVGSSGTLTQHVQRVPTALAAAPAVLGLDPLHLSLLNLSATLTRADTGAPLAGQVVQFSAGGSAICSATTGGDGVATCNGVSGVTATLLAGGYTATFTGTAVYAPSTARGAAVQV